MIQKADLLTLLRKETATTVRVMRAFPADQATFSPHERSSDAMKLMKTFVFETWLLKSNLFGETVEPAQYGSYAPAGIEEVIADFEKESAACISSLDAMTDEQLAGTVEFAGVSYDKSSFALMMVCDQIHHRGQLSVYVRMAGGKVPSIYGPSADDDATNL